MAVSQETKEVVRREILVLNEEINKLSIQLNTAKSKRDAAQDVVAKLQLHGQNLLAKKQALLADIQ